MIRSLKVALIFLLSFIVAVISLPSISSVGADNDKDQYVSLPIQKVKPGVFYYPVKRLWEKLKINLIFSLEGKINYRELLMKKRLSELKFVVEKQKFGQIEKASNRFSYEAGELTNLVEGSTDGVVKEKYFKEFEKYKLVLPLFRDQFAANTSNWLLIQQNIDTLNFLQERLK